MAELLKFWTQKIIEIEPTEKERSSLDLLLETCLSSGLQEQLSTQEARRGDAGNGSLDDSRNGG